MKVQLKVFGRVQGVGFRYYTKQIAEGLGLTGWVKNNLDYTVSISAEGDKPTLDRFIAMIEKGPTYGRVDQVDKEWSQEEEGLHYFQIKL